MGGVESLEGVTCYGDGDKISDKIRAVLEREVAWMSILR